MIIYEDRLAALSAAISIGVLLAIAAPGGEREDRTDLTSAQACPLQAIDTVKFGFVQPIVIVPPAFEPLKPATCT
jgi:hypothetical protein